MRRGVVVLFEDSQGRLAWQLRDDGPPANGSHWWGLFGGWMEGDETPLLAAVREMREELGLKLDPHQLNFLRAWEVLDDVCAYIFHVQALNGLAEARLAEGRAFAFWHVAELEGQPVVGHHARIAEWYRSFKLHSD